MLIDAFLCTCSRDPMRYGLALATLARLKMSKAINLTLMRTGEALLEDRNCYTIHCSDLEFRVKRRMRAESLATTPIYILADDDVLPFDNDWADKGLEIMERNPDYAAVMLRPIGFDRLETYGGNDELDEFDEVGGLWFMRKGVVTDWPTEYTEELGWHSLWETKIIHGKGMKTGMFKQLLFNHLGRGFSTLFWNENGYGPIPAP